MLATTCGVLPTPSLSFLSEKPHSSEWGFSFFDVSICYLYNQNMENKPVLRSYYFDQDVATFVSITSEEHNLTKTSVIHLALRELLEKTHDEIEELLEKHDMSCHRRRRLPRTKVDFEIAPARSESDSDSVPRLRSAKRPEGGPYISPLSSEKS